ncbi:MAG TPA: hypothetical protein VHB02_07015 [Acidimicrobiales bacterium]|nr:hypothetical protein [Acidimicrobiales bacterium]
MALGSPRDDSAGLPTLRVRLAEVTPRRLLSALPPGTLPVCIGLVVTGVTAYAYLILTARVLGPDKYAPLSVLWAIVFLTGPGVFLPLEQEVGRLYAQRRVEGLGAGSVARRAGFLGAGLAAVLLVGVWIGSGHIDRDLFDGQGMLLVAFCCALIGYLLLSLAWGILAGSGRFGSYAVAQGTDGAFRIVVCTFLAVAGIRSAGPYGLVMGLTPTLAALLAMSRNTDLLAPGPPAHWSDLSSALGWLLVGSIGAQALANSSIIAVKLLASPSQDAQAGNFLAGVVIARVPLFLFGAVQAALLPRLATLCRAGQARQFRSGMLRLLYLVGAIGVASVGVAYAVGPWILQLLFGSRFALGRGDLALLAAGNAAYMLALAIVQALIAVGHHARSAVGWLVGLGVFAGVVLVGSSVLFRVELAFFLGSVAALAVATILLRSSVSGIERNVDPEKLMVPVSELGIEP